SSPSPCSRCSATWLHFTPGSASPRGVSSPPGSRPAGGGTCKALPPPAPQEHHRDRPQNDPEALEHRAALDVLEIVPQLATHVVQRRVVVLTDLREPGHPRKDTLPLAVAVDPCAQHREDPRLLRTRAHHIHVTATPVEELRQLAQPRPPEPPPDGRHPRIVRRRPLLHPVIRADVHRPELVDLERLASMVDPPASRVLAPRPATVDTDPDLRVQDRARRGESHDQS